MLATHFEFNGISSKDVGIKIVSIDDSKNGEYDSNNEIEYNTSKPSASNRWNMHGCHYENPISFSFQITKCNMKEFSPEEQAYYKRWLECTDGYKYLRFLAEGYEKIYFYCTLQLQWYGIASQCVGATVQVTCDSPWAYSDIQTYEASLQSGSSFFVYNDADGIGQTDMDLIEIQALEDGNIDISNDLYDIYLPQKLKLQGRMVIKNCVAGEIIIINGLNKQILSNKAHEYLADDYSYSPICLINYDEKKNVSIGNCFHEQNRKNIFRNHGVACNINLAYRTNRMVVI